MAKKALIFTNNYNEDRPKPLRHDHKYWEEGNPTLNLTGLPGGKNGAHMASCNPGGFFQIVIITENK